MAEDKADTTQTAQPDYLSYSPEAAQSNIFNRLNLRDQSSLISTSRYWNNRFRITFLKNLLKHFLHYVARGMETEAIRLFESNPDLLNYYGSVTDISGRTFPRITAFQYALWSWDVKHMGRKFIRCLPKGEQGKLLQSELLRQLEELEQVGVSYDFNGQTITGEKHFDFKPLFDAYKTLIKSFNDPEKSRVNWMKVGEAQKGLPANIRQEYCNPNESFTSEDLFSNDNLKRSLKFFNYVTNRTEVWDEKLSGLGETFAIERSASRICAFGGSAATGGSVLDVDFMALVKLHNVRTANLKQLKEVLQDTNLHLDEASLGYSATK